MASASRCRFAVDLDTISVHPYTDQLCQYFGLRTLGLIASGALLATVPSSAAAALLAAYRTARLPAAIIGRVVAGRGVEARSGGRRVKLPWSERDELTKLFGH
jgi:hydrogenase maturation factor